MGWNHQLTMDSMGYDQTAWGRHVWRGPRNLQVRDPSRWSQKRRVQVRVTHMLHGWKMFLLIYHEFTVSQF